jgi:uncharacterized protein YprB with RNaseH-like and TPR domain
VTLERAVTLERRLANYRSAIPRAESGPLDGWAEPQRPKTPSDHAARLASAVNGEVVRTDLGTFVRAETQRTLIRVDRERLARLPGQPPSDVPLVCLDTETTGLGSATGTLAFLIGLGWWEGDMFRQIQLFLPDQSDEVALLTELSTHIPADAWLVTYNGRGFDWPLLVTRFRMARRPAPRHAGHLDLLPLVRGIFKHRMANARLRSVEETLLGVRRHHDVEGWEIPGRYLDFLRGGSAQAIEEVAVHNNEDVRSLARLLAHVETLLADDAGRRGAHPGDLAGLASAFGRERRHTEALRCLDAALEAPAFARDVRQERRSWTVLLTTRADEALAPSPPALSRNVREDGVAYLPARPTVVVDRDRLLVDRARLLRRVGRDSEAFETWQDLARGGGPHAVAAWIEVAKVLEHRRRDPTGALAATRAAQEVVRRSRFIGRPVPRLEVQLAARAQRLGRRIHGIRVSVVPVIVGRAAAGRREACSPSQRERHRGPGRTSTPSSAGHRPAR